MNVNDFVILPGSKTGMSAKLKAKSVRELQLEKVQLELDNKEMERKLQQLQSNMSREKLERERANGYRWKSGQAGLGVQPQFSQNKESTAKISSGKVKLRVLKEQTQVLEPAKQLAAHRCASAASTEKPKVKGKPCGQCETKTALLVCLDCGEDYCPSCFARVHQKGALKLHRTTCLQAKAHIPVEKLQAAQQFLKKIYPSESNGKINYEQKKEVNLLEDSPGIPSPLPKTPTHDTEEAFTVPTEVKSECQMAGSLLHGTFNEEESAKLFQEALNQWRNRNSPRKQTEERCCQSEPENTETCEAQTSPPIMKKTMEIKFQEDSLKYVEKLWLQKYKRTPFDMLPDVLEDKFKPTKSPINEVHDTWVGEEEENDEEIVNARLAAEEMKKFWADVKKEEPEAVPVNFESSLKIEILEDACKEEPEESASFVIMEAGSEEFEDYSSISENHKTEPGIFLAQAVDIPAKSPFSSAVDKENDLTSFRNKHEETPRASSPSVQSERMDILHDLSSPEEVSSILYERAATKEKPIVMKKNCSHVSPGQISSPLELAPRESSPLMEFHKDCERALELREASSVTTKCSLLLQEVALKEKPICSPYRGFEGFFAVSTNSQEVMADLFPSPRSGRQSPSKGISFSGSEQWIRDSSISECADETVVKDVLILALARPSSRLGRQTSGTKASLSISPSEKAIPRPFSSKKPHCRTAAEDRSRPSSALPRGPRSSPTVPLSRAASEISEIEDIDVTEHDDPFLEDNIDRQALADLESELQMNAALQEKLSGVLSDSSAFKRHSEVTSHNCTAFHNSHEIKDYSKCNTIRVYDDHTDDEEELWQDKQQVMELH